MRILPRRSPAVYWTCQLLGWFSMVLIEMVNYTFFIVGSFNWKTLYSFIFCAFTGIIFTHLYRLLIKKRKLFSASLTYIWLHAFLATLVISLFIMLTTELTFILLSKKVNKELFSFIAIAGFTINWMRYTGVWIIIYFMYKLLRQNAKIQQEKLQVENIAKTTELELLKMQLNPHFLFNALNSIKALVILDPGKSRNAIVELSELLRFTLQYGKESFIRLQDELEEVKKYLSLEKLRFEERLEVKDVIDPLLYNAKIPPAILLTLVENAIKHGVAKNIGTTLISMDASVQSGGSILCIRVSNTGTYIQHHSGGIGLKHITRRLEELYGDKAVITIEGHHGTVTASLQIPLTYVH